MRLARRRTAGVGFMCELPLRRDRWILRANGILDAEGIGPTWHRVAGKECGEEEVIGAPTTKREPPTAADVIVMAISPALIIGLVGSLVFFLAEVFYAGR